MVWCVSKLAVAPRMLSTAKSSGNSAKPESVCVAEGPRRQGDGAAEQAADQRDQKSERRRHDDADHTFEGGRDQRDAAERSGTRTTDAVCDLPMSCLRLATYAVVAPITKGEATKRPKP